MSLRNDLRIMVVDDMSTSRALITQALEELAIRHVSSSADAVAALQALAKSPVHLVISDFNMPGMDGLGLLRELRQNQRTQNVGFILITGRADNEMIQQGQQLGMNNFITKPFTTGQLRDCIEAVVGRL